MDNNIRKVSYKCGYLQYWLLQKNSAEYDMIL